MALKRVTLYLGVLLMWCASSVIAEVIETSLMKGEYAPGETVQADISLDNPVEDPKLTSISLTEGKTKVSITPFLKKVSVNHYFLFFTLPLTAKNGTYALHLSNIPFIVNGTLKEVSSAYNITVKKEGPFISLFPGVFIISDEKDIQLAVTNKGQSTFLTVQTPPFISHSYQQPQTLNEGATRTLKFTLLPLPEEVRQANITLLYEKEYIIPLFFASQQQPPQGNEGEEKNPIVFITESAAINRTLKQQVTLEGDLTIKNTLNTTAENISVFLTGDLVEIGEVTPSLLTLHPLGEVVIHLVFNRRKSLEKEYYTGGVAAMYHDYALFFPITLRRLSEPSSGGIETMLNETRAEPSKHQQAQETFFNYTFAQKVKGAQKHPTLISFIIILFVVMLIMMWMKKTTTKKRTFSEYIKEVEKKR